MGSILGGKQSSTTELPGYIVDQSQRTFDTANQASQIGYTPYYGPVVAALSPLQEAAMRNTASAASAFGLSTPQSDPLAQINGTTAPVDVASTSNPEAAAVIQQAYRDQLGRDPDAAGFDFWMNNYDPQSFQNDFAAGVRMDPLTGLTMPGTTNGVRGYSSAPLFETALDELKQRRPGQFDGIMNMFMDPYSGAAPANGILNTAMAAPAQTFNAANYGGDGGNYGGVAGGPNDPSGGGVFGGYTGLGDFFDGGGPGQSGNTFGGALGGISNGLGQSPGQGIFGLF